MNTFSHGRREIIYFRSIYGNNYKNKIFFQCLLLTAFAGDKVWMYKDDWNIKRCLWQMDLRHLMFEAPFWEVIPRGAVKEKETKKKNKK